MLQQTNVFVTDWSMLFGPGLRQLDLHHQRSIRGYTSSEMESFATPCDAAFIGFRRTLHQNLPYNKIGIRECRELT